MPTLILSRTRPSLRWERISVSHSIATAASPTAAKEPDKYRWLIGAMSAHVQVFGRRHDEAIHALRRPASEKRQCTKSREFGTRQCSECYGDRMLVAISMVDAARAECLHNFRVLA